MQMLVIQLDFDTVKARTHARKQAHHAHGNPAQLSLYALGIVMQLLEDMVRDGVQPNQQTYSAAIGAAARCT